MHQRTQILVVALLTVALPLLAQEASQAITHGPVVESVNANSAVIAWTTNVSAGTVVRFGTDPNNLNNGAAMPWGGYTHRVTLQNLRPDTTYYLQASSPDVQGTGATLSGSIFQIHTSPLWPCLRGHLVPTELFDCHHLAPTTHMPPNLLPS